MQQLNSHSKNERGIRETNQQGRLMRKAILGQARPPTQGCVTLHQDDRDRMRLQALLPHSPDPALCKSDPCVVHRPLIPNSPALQLKAQMVGPNPDLVNQKIRE